MTSPAPARTAPGPLPQRAFNELLVLAEIARQQFEAAEARRDDHPLSPKAHLRVHTLRRVIETLAALMTMFAGVGAAAPQPKARRPRPSFAARRPATRRAASRPATLACAGAAPNPNAPHRARPTAPNRPTHPGAATRPRPPQHRHQAP